MNENTVKIVANAAVKICKSIVGGLVMMTLLHGINVNIKVPETWCENSYREYHRMREEYRRMHDDDCDDKKEEN